MAWQAKQGKILQLEMENFKSFKGFHTIGPFRNFTAIIGPNGAGKSNLMDAISFVLGVRSSHLRGTHLTDLIYTHDDEENEQSGRKAFVRLVYKMRDESEIKFTRIITERGVSEYRVDGRVVNSDEYNSTLKSIGILVKARNFLVFQGDVESICTKNPKELTTLIEQISGSDELKKDYEGFNEQMVRAQVESALIYSEKRNIIAERKVKKAQKAKAEKHLHLHEELKELKTEHFHWQLYNIQKDIERMEARLEEERKCLDAVRQKDKECKLEIETKKKEHNVYLKRIISSDEHIAKKRQELDEKLIYLLKLKEGISRTKLKLKSCGKELEKKKDEERKHGGEIEKMRHQLQAIKIQIDQLEDEFQLADDQLAEYHRIKQEAGTKTAKLKDEKEVHERQLHADEEAQRNIEENLHQLQDREKELSSQKDEVKSMLEKIRTTITKHQDDLVVLRNNLSEISELQSSTKSRYSDLKVRVDEMEIELRELKAFKHERKRDACLFETLRSLKQLFPGVRGSMTELCTTTQKKYKRAVTVAMGKFMDAIIVEDENTSQECIKYLKKHRLPPQTFIPLQSLDMKPIAEKLRSLGETTRLVIDVLQFDPSLEKAVLYAVGSTLVCDHFEDARKISWSEKKRYKVATLDGMLLTKSGTMTGGISEGLEARSNKWNEAEIEAIKKKKAQFETDLAELRSPQELQKEEIEVSEKITGLERKIHYMNFQEKNTIEKLLRIENEIATINEQISHVKLELHKSTSLISKKKEEARMLEKRINEILDTIYKDFSISVGVQNFREFEGKQLDLEEKKLKVRTQLSKLKYQIDYEQKRDMKVPIMKLESSYDSLKKDMNNLLEKDYNGNKEAEQISKELDKTNEWKDKSDQYDIELEDLKKKNAVISAEIAKLEHQVKSKELVLVQLVQKKQDIHERLAMEQLELQAIDDPLEIDGDSSDQEELHNESIAAVRDKIEADFMRKIITLEAEIENTAPYLKALDQYEVLLKREEDVNTRYKIARNGEKDITNKFYSVKQRRYELFMEAFNHISTNIDKIYKGLTKSTTHPLGGTAYLNLENEDEPYLHGIDYTAMPPTKRFCDIECLSGGEKTIAALAFVFSIHSFRPAPFFILDEVDAALDNLNVLKVANFIRMKCCAESSEIDPGFQAIIISLKDSFYDKAESLIGVCRDASMNCSRTLSFDLMKCDG